VSSITIVSDDPNCGVTHDDSRGVIYDRKIFIIEATEVTNAIAESVGKNDRLFSIVAPRPLFENIFPL
jgi:hypothetical protein